jgi:assimilatory nitrate reductase catalytic subunit
LAGSEVPTDWAAAASALFGLEDAEIQQVTDPARGIARIAFFRNGGLLAALFVSPEPVAVMRDYLAAQPGQDAPQILTGASPADQPDPGPMVCACFNVGVNTILSAIETQSLLSVEAIGAALEAGTNCGSCRPELAALLASTQHKEAAE